jgi:hypothetical protein
LADLKEFLSSVADEEGLDENEWMVEAKKMLNDVDLNDETV